MSHDPIATMNAILNQIQPTNATMMLNPVLSNSSNTEIPSLDWKADYYAALTAWKPVKEYDENGTHDHTPMPPPEMITSIQLGFILKAARPEPKRKPKTPAYKHKLCVEVWTVPHDQIIRHKRATQWRRFSQLRTEAGFEKTLTGAVASKFITQDFADWATAILHDRAPNTGLNDLWGIFHDNNGHWTYYDEHLIRIDMSDSNKPVAHLYRNRVKLTILELETEYAGHKLPDGGTQTHVIRTDFE